MKRLLCIFLAVSALMPAYILAAPKKTVYMTYILHGNMNYDRYVRPVIWQEFPAIYDNLLDFMDAHPDFRGQLQFSGQTYGSLMQAAPEVIDHAKAVHRRGQLNFTGTFYSEPVNVNMDGETNFRCARLGTEIIEEQVGATDGFYLQERAYHPQLPWILNHSHVSWTPVITNDDSWYPFRLKGLDGSLSVCVPITRDDFIPRVEQAPGNALIAIEEDYEIPQTFADAYARAKEFNDTRRDIRIEWITVKDYIDRFGLKEEKFIDHSVMANIPDRGSYSRWTADPLDIIIQESTNRAMSDFRLANALDALSWNGSGSADQSFETSGISLKDEPLAWNIERAELYPDHEKHLLRNGVMTVLSKADQLLLWAVNSDAKGWFPLYERRRERLNSLRNSSELSRYVINKILDSLAEHIKPQDYEAYFIVLNLERERRSRFTVPAQRTCKLYDLSSGCELPVSAVSRGGTCEVEVEMELPAYGYVTIGAKNSVPNREEWVCSSSVSSDRTQLQARGDTLVVKTPGHEIELYLDSFLIKALAHMDYGEGDSDWRTSAKYGPVRTYVNTAGIHPRLKMEWQPDWLMHVSAVFTITGAEVECEMTVDFPHPSVIRREGMDLKRTNFRPEGLNLVVKSGQPCTLGYDIPFGISEMSREGLSYFCPLTSCFLNYGNRGLLFCPQTGEQAFSLNADTGELTLFLGASTTSGPIREMGLEMEGLTRVKHDFEWYAEPFHGSYRHKFTLMFFDGNWKEAHIPAEMRRIQQEPYVKQVFPGEGQGQGCGSFIEGLPINVEVSDISREDGRLTVRLNEREGRTTQLELTINGEKRSGIIGPYGIANF